MLLTTRDVRLGAVPVNVARHVVDVLGSEAAVDLLARLAPECANDPALPDIAEAVGFLPLALTPLGASLREAVRTPDQLLAALQAEPNTAEFELFRRSLEGADLPQGHEAGVYAVLTEGLGRLSPEARTAVSGVGYVADAPVPDALVRALTGLDDDDALNAG
jgi:hypothetical protein